MKRWAKLSILALATFAIAACGIAEWAWDFVHISTGHDSILAIVILFVAVANFYGSLIIFGPKDGESLFPKEVVRDAIAASLIITYFVVLVIAIFYVHKDDKLPAMTETMIGSFTTVVGIVVVFYFGSIAFIHVQEAKNGASKKGKRPVRNGLKRRK